MPKKLRLPGIRTGKAWGNALGGYKTQRRDLNGRFGSSGGIKRGPGSPTAPRAKKPKKPKKSGNGANAAAAAPLYNVNKVASKNNTTKVSRRSPILKDQSTSFRHKSNRSQEQFKNGTITRQAGVIPYTRHGFSSHTAGVNGGLRVLPNYRLSAGAYIKVQNIDKTRREKHVRDKDNKIVLGLASKISPHRKLDGITANLIKKVRRRQVDKLVGGEAQVGKKSWARVTTDQNAMPTVTIEYNRSASRNAKRKAARNQRREALWAYNDMVTKNRGTNVKPRAQRRGK